MYLECLFDESINVTHRHIATSSHNRSHLTPFAINIQQHPSTPISQHLSGSCSRLPRRSPMTFLSKRRASNTTPSTVILVTSPANNPQTKWKRENPLLDIWRKWKVSICLDVTLYMYVCERYCKQYSRSSIYIVYMIHMYYFLYAHTHTRVHIIWVLYVYIFFWNLTTSIFWVRIWTTWIRQSWINSGK